MAFNINSSFVSRSIVQDDSEKTLDSDQYGKEVKLQDHDPRTLYERLEEQRNLREEKFAEDSRLSNHIKRLDEEETEYFKTLSEQKKKTDAEKKLKEQLELEKYRQEVEDARTVSQPLTAKQTKPKNLSSRRNIVQSKPKNKFKDIVVIKKREREEEKKDEKSEKETPEPKKAKTDDKGSLSLLSAYSDDEDDE